MSLQPFLSLTRNALSTRYFLHNFQSYLCERAVENSQNLFVDSHVADIQKSDVSQEQNRNFAITEIAWEVCE